MRDINPIRNEIYRKMIHMLSSVLGIAVLIFDSHIIIPVMIALGIILPVMDLLRFRIRFFSFIFRFFFQQVARPYEHKGLTGAAWVFISAALTVLLFDKIAAGTGLLFLSIGDSFAAIIGIKYGSTRIGNKSLEGTTAFIVSSIVVVLLIPGLNPVIGVTAAIVAAVFELVPLKGLDDNLVIPLVSAFTIQMLGLII